MIGLAIVLPKQPMAVLGGIRWRPVLIGLQDEFPQDKVADSRSGRACSDHLVVI